MRRSNELEQRLIEWADEYRVGKYENIGYPGRSWLHNAILYQGPSPQGLNPKGTGLKTPGDEVEEAVLALERQVGCFRAGRILRAEYYMVKASEATKRDSLKVMGLQMSRATFYDELWVARVHVAAWLRISACVELPVSAA